MRIPLLEQESGLGRTGEVSRYPGAAGIEAYLVLLERREAFGQTSYDIGSYGVV